MSASDGPGGGVGWICGRGLLSRWGMVIRGRSGAGREFVFIAPDATGAGWGLWPLGMAAAAAAAAGLVVVVGDVLCPAATRF